MKIVRQSMEMKIVKRGRPPISDSTKQNRLAVMLTDDERAQLDAGAAVAGQPTSTWARTVLLAAAAELTAQQPAARKKAAKRQA